MSGAGYFNNAKDRRAVKISQKITVNISVIVLILGGLILGVAVYFRNELTRNVIVDHIRHLEESFIRFEEQDIKFLSAALEVFVQNQSFKDVYLEMDREKLYSYAEPLFRDLKNKYRITHFYFILPDGR